MPIIISHKNKYICTYIPKSACTTIRCVLANIEGIEFVPNWTVKDKKHIKTKFNFLRGSKQIERYEDYKYFTFVRNPWDRLVSCYFDKIIFVREVKNNKWVKNGMYKEFNKYKPKVPFNEMEFKDFVEFVISVPDNRCDIHFKPQHMFINMERLDFLGKVERLSLDMKLLFPDINLSDIPKLWSKPHKNYTCYYDDNLKKMVKQKYQKDIELFNYSFPSK